MSKQEADVTALVIPVPEADPIVDRWRAKYDWSASHGLGSHVTVLFPYLPASMLCPSRLDKLRRLLASHEAISFRLRGPRCLRNYAYFEPEPSAPFVRLMEETQRLHPDCVPFRAGLDEAIPHLTVAFSLEHGVLEEVIRALEGVEIHTVARRVHLLECRNDEWRFLDEFSLGAGRKARAPEALFQEQ